MTLSSNTVAAISMILNIGIQPSGSTKTHMASPSIWVEVRKEGETNDGKSCCEKLPRPRLIAFSDRHLQLVPACVKKVLPFLFVPRRLDRFVRAANCKFQRAAHSCPGTRRPFYVLTKIFPQIQDVAHDVAAK